MTDSWFRFPYYSSVALGYEEPEGQPKSREDIASDMDYRDQLLEDFLSNVAAGTTGVLSTGTESWTPGVAGTGWAYTAGSRSGAYQKIGNIVVASFSIVFGAVGDGGSGQLQITGLPHAAMTGQKWFGSGVWYDDSLDDSFDATFILDPGATAMTAWYGLVNNAFVLADLRTGITETAPFTFAAGDEVHGSITYLSA